MVVAKKATTHAKNWTFDFS